MLLQHSPDNIHHSEFGERPENSETHVSWTKTYSFLESQTSTQNRPTWNHGHEGLPDTLSTLPAKL